MKSFQTKWKMVSFRLSAGDYAEALEACRASGHRSMSSFALHAMRALVPAMLPSQDHEHELSRRVDNLFAAVKRVLEAVGTEPGRHCKVCGAGLAFQSGRALSAGLNGEVERVPNR
jgi:hypothetical protein